MRMDKGVLIVEHSRYKGPRQPPPPRADPAPAAAGPAPPGVRRALQEPGRCYSRGLLYGLAFVGARVETFVAKASHKKSGSIV